MTKGVRGSEVVKPMLSSELYDKIRALVQYILPGLGTLYFSLSQIWGLDYGEQVVGTTAALGVFFGIVMGLSKRSYEASDAKYDGALVVDTSDPETDSYVFEVDTPLIEIQSKKELNLRVESNDESV